MKLCVKYLLLAAVFSGILSALHAQAPQAGDETKQPRFPVPIPVGNTAKGVTIPDAESGKKKMLLNIDELTRTDNDHIQMINTKIETYDDQEKPDMTLLLPISVLDLNTRLLTTDKPFILRRADFQLFGETLRMDTVTKRGKVVGKVKMIIYNFEEPKRKTDEAPKAAESQKKETKHE